MKTFNRGKPFHGSDAIQGGKLRGQTGDTDYFSFLCPRCKKPAVLRILDYGVIKETDDNRYNELLSPKATSGFILAFKLYCQECGFKDFVKLSNEGLQGGPPTRKDSLASPN
jgi:hypothetical protein